MPLQPSTIEAETTVNHLIALLVGVLAGTHIATWGMFKDSIHEGFTPLKYSRSIILGGILALGIARVVGVDLFHPPDLLLLFGITYVAERGVSELYKGFLREEDQSKYFIPMQFHIFGRLVHRRRARWSVAGALVVAVSLLGMWIHRIPSVTPDLKGAFTVFLVGGLGGLLVAFGGAWKDGPFEGFEWLKFFRSPLVAGAYAVLLLPASDRPLELGLAGIGFSVATLETYKTFVLPSKPRGKFAGKPILYPRMLRKRLGFVPVYLAIWVGILAAFLATCQPE